MTLKIQIKMDNDAFADENSGEECARILRELATECSGGRLSRGFVRRLNDINGNKVGMAEIKN